MFPRGGPKLGYLIRNDYHKIKTTKDNKEDRSAEGEILLHGGAGTNKSSQIAKQISAFLFLGVTQILPVPLL